LDIAHGIRERDIDDRRERPGIEAHGVFNVLPHCRDVSTYGRDGSVSSGIERFFNAAPL